MELFLWGSGKLIESNSLTAIDPTESLSNGKFIEQKVYRTEILSNGKFTEQKIYRTESSSNSN